VLKRSFPYEILFAGLPNKRLKLAAPGLGRIPFVPQRTSCPCVSLFAPADWGAAA